MARLRTSRFNYTGMAAKCCLLDLNSERSLKVKRGHFLPSVIRSETTSPARSARGDVRAEARVTQGGKQEDHLVGLSFLRTLLFLFRGLFHLLLVLLESAQ